MNQDNEELEMVEEMELEEPAAGEEAEALAPDEAQGSGAGETKTRNLAAALIGIVVVALGLCTALVCIVGAFLVFSNSGSASVSGEILYRERIALSPDAVVHVQIQDVSRADAPATVVGEQTIRNPGQVPIAFEVGYDGSDIEENHTYALAARIEDPPGNLMFINTQIYPVITRATAASSSVFVGSGRSPWQRLNLSPDPQEQGSLRPRAASSVA